MLQRNIIHKVLTLVLQNAVLFFFLPVYCKEETGTFPISKSPLETTIKIQKKNKTTDYFHFSVGVSFGMAFLWFLFLKFPSMSIKCITIILFEQEPSNPNKYSGDSWYSASLLRHVFLQLLFSITLAIIHVSVWFIAYLNNCTKGAQKVHKRMMPLIFLFKNITLLYKA